MFTHAFSRRITLTLCGLLLAFILLPAAAQANSPAKQALETATDRILSFIKNPDYVNPATRGPIRQQIEDEVLHIFDFGEFSSRTVGPRWRTFTPAQKKAFSDAFADLLINTYVNKIDGYNGEQVIYTGEVASAKGDRVEVRSVITMKDGKKVPVAYRMLPKNGKWLVYDVLIENISLVKNYRTQFQDILNTDSPENLIARIKSKAMEVRQEHGK
ncbi:MULTISPECIES: MlaC/ttg2D family ABC transporter substrate-binding protein [Desulfovibrio]|uniref:Phospholipid transport system substrate-binding protein n=1 Tax=Desulfovibrio intestinalis TaxID=58621 RepID=A0A7W8C050_9BACT|nr:ABC transporter substrate-binding protein [Desulfovibrio intestinalis]MBB5143155.1 phospholipid transport system substrate-binding protein [Desulfovibrio intestinalis]